jgi:hypothetical protein
MLCKNPVVLLLNYHLVQITSMDVREIGCEEDDDLRRNKENKQHTHTLHAPTKPWPKPPFPADVLGAGQAHG